MDSFKLTFKIFFIVFIIFGNVKYLSSQRNNQSQPIQHQGYSLEQAISQRAQLHTMAFSGLAFLTGNFGADCFFPPGKVADFFGFQYMRDNDKNKMGHNTDFLTRIAYNIIHILSQKQLQWCIELANKQASIYDEFAKKRMILIKAFRVSLEKETELNKTEIIKFGGELYQFDAELSYERALLYGKIVNSFTKEQKEYLAKLDFGNSDTWPLLPETLDKKNMSHRAHMAVMTYASEFYSWYAGSETADVYFCPERHATYFGGFYLKDYPAMGNKDYNISTALTGDKGKEFIDALTQEQSACLINTIAKDNIFLNEIVNIRRQVSLELRKVLKNEIPDKDRIYSFIKHYGELDAEISYDYAICFAFIHKSLGNEQKEKLKIIRNLDILPKGTYLFSDPMEMPQNIVYDNLILRK